MQLTKRVVRIVSLDYKERQQRSKEEEEEDDDDDDDLRRRKKKKMEEGEEKDDARNVNTWPGTLDLVRWVESTIPARTMALRWDRDGP